VTAFSETQKLVILGSVPPFDSFTSAASSSTLSHNLNDGKVLPFEPSFCFRIFQRNRILVETDIGSRFSLNSTGNYWSHPQCTPCPRLPIPRNGARIELVVQGYEQESLR
jgi:hypothetical protein